MTAEPTVAELRAFYDHAQVQRARRNERCRARYQQTTTAGRRHGDGVVDQEAIGRVRHGVGRPEELTSQEVDAAILRFAAESPPLTQRQIAELLRMTRAAVSARVIRARKRGLTT